MLKIRYHVSFKKDYKRIVKRGYDTKLYLTRTGTHSDLF